MSHADEGPQAMLGSDCPQGPSQPARLSPGSRRETLRLMLRVRLLSLVASCSLPTQS